MRPAGDFKHFVTILVLSDGAESDYGDDPATYGPSYSCFAAIEPLSGEETFYARQLRPGVTHRVAFRNPRSVLTGRCRMTWAGKTFELTPLVLDDALRGFEAETTAFEVQSPTVLRA